MQIVLQSDRAVDQPDGDESGLHRPSPSDVLIANTGTYDLGLIDQQLQVADARTYLPEVGRFTSSNTYSTML